MSNESGHERDGGSCAPLSGPPTGCPFATKAGEAEQSVMVMPQGPWTARSFASMLRTGRNFYPRLMQELKSTVFEIGLFGSRVIICDWKGIQSMLHSEDAVREGGFGILKMNRDVLPSHVPVVFSNGKEHEVKKGALMKLLEVTDRNWDFGAILNLVRSEMQKICPFSEHEDFEKKLGRSMGNVVTTILLGKTFPDDHLDNWIELSLSTPLNVFSRKAASLNAFNDMYADMKSTPRIQEMINEHLPPGMSGEDFIKDMIWAVGFNAYGAIAATTTSFVATFLQLSQEDLNKLREDAKLMFSSRPLSERLRAPFIEGFVYEVLRLYPPAATAHCKTIRDTVLESSAGNFRIKNGQMMSSSFSTSHRDPVQFPDPDTLNIHRYMKDSSLLKYIMSFGGSLVEKPSPRNRLCPGMDLALTILKAFVANLVFCDVEFKEKPVFTGNLMSRLSASDKPLKVRSFVVHDIPK